MAKLPSRLQSISRTLAYVLRHNPSHMGLTLDSQGWVSLESVLEGAKLTLEELHLIVDTNSKKRFSIKDGMIRANQGHSMGVDLGLSETTPPDFLYHGTAESTLKSISEQGLIKGSRDHVHLSIDRGTAYKIGSRHGEPVILVVNAKQAHADGHKFIVSDNSVWLTDHVPAKYLQKWVIV